jgi:hypothetical protein
VAACVLFLWLAGGRRELLGIFMSQNNRLAVSLTWPKQTALYFDYVMPINLSFDFIMHMKHHDALLDDQRYTKFQADYFFDLAASNMRNGLIPQELSNRADFVEELGDLNVKFHIYFVKRLGQRFKLEKPHWVTQHDYDTIDDVMPSMLREFAKKFALTEAPIDVSADDFVELPNAGAYENYRGKDRAFIEDDISTRIYDYGNAVKQWGFSTKEGVINIFLQSKLLTGSSIAALTSVLMGAPLTAIMVGAGGGAIEVGKAALFWKKQQMVFQSSIASNPVSYVSYATEKAGT